MNILLPISKSIANRVLIRQAYLGLPLMEVDPVRDPDDVVLLQEALATLLHPVPELVEGQPSTLNLQNCGTAMRFLTAFCAQKDGMHVVLDGCERMRHRPIGQLVDALRTLGAKITYTGEEGFPPVEIRGRGLDTLESPDNPEPLAPLMQKVASTQFVSAMLLVNLPVSTDAVSPYIDLTRAVVQEMDVASIVSSSEIERDWSAAAFWMERWALGLCERPDFPGLNPDSLQGDRVCRPLFEHIHDMQAGEILEYDFSKCPDLYPAVAIACEQKGIRLEATGTESLRIKESDRITAIHEHRTYHDHRIAMALLAANLHCDDTECIKKSYPLFVEQLSSIS